MKIVGIQSVVSTTKAGEDVLTSLSAELYRKIMVFQLSTPSPRVTSPNATGLSICSPPDVSPYHLLQYAPAKVRKPSGFPDSRARISQYTSKKSQISWTTGQSPYQNRASENVLCKQAIFAVTILALLIAYVHYTIFRVN